MIPPLLVTAESIASAFHEHYERHAKAIGYSTRTASAVPWDEVPAQNKWLMISVVYGLLLSGVIKPGPTAHKGEVDAHG